VCARSGLAGDAVVKIIAAQASRLSRLRAADLVVFNDGITIEDLARQVHQMSTQFKL
jgi:dephospho-CoA kinase